MDCLIRNIFLNPIISFGLSNLEAIPPFRLILDCVIQRFNGLHNLEYTQIHTFFKYLTYLQKGISSII